MSAQNQGGVGAKRGMAFHDAAPAWATFGALLVAAARRSAIR